VISDSWDEGLTIAPALLGKTKACCLISRKSEVTMNMKDMNYPLDMNQHERK
jgi:hypothetical protein